MRQKYFFYKNSLLSLLVILLLASCQNKESNTTLDQVVVWAKDQPQGLNPIINLNEIENNISSKLFLPLADYNPETLKLEPVLLSSLSNSEILTKGKYKGFPAYKISINPAATWDDGSQVNINDYLFTLKSIKSPLTNSPRYRAAMIDILDVIEIENDNLTAFVVFKEESMRGLELTTNFPILPEYIYDPKHIMRSVEIPLLDDEDAFLAEVEQTPELKSQADRFNELKIDPSQVVGGGRYKLESWVSNQYVRLTKKENHWLSDNKSSLVQAHPKSIVYSITPDETAALTQLKAGQFDIMEGVSSIQFKEMKEDQDFADKFNFRHSRLLRYYFIGLNMRKPILKDIAVRQALSYLIQVDTIIAKMEDGEGERINSPFLTTDKYSKLADKTFSVQKAIEILENAGWRDSNQNGTRDKLVDGKLTELEIYINITKKQLGTFIANLFKQDAKKAGINININQLEGNVYVSKVRSHDFDMIVSASSQSLAPYDPYTAFHSDNLGVSMGNNYGFADEQADAIIEAIADEKDVEKRNKLYLELEEIIYEEIPMIFLYSPVSRIIFKNTLDGVISKKRPGYFPETFYQK